jgi:hypothetical protein
MRTFTRDIARLAPCVAQKGDWHVNPHRWGQDCLCVSLRLFSGRPKRYTAPSEQRTAAKDGACGLTKEE